jgi:group I intron endonuclease
MSSDVQLETGVYAIRCTVNGKSYVGSAARSFDYRWRKHVALLRLGTHHSKPLQLAWNKYGESAFVCDILARCHPSECVTQEQVFIDSMNTTNRKCGYNVCPKAGSSLGYKHTEESRQKMSLKQQGQVKSQDVRRRISERQKGRKRPEFSKEWKSNIGIAIRGIKRTDETRARMSLAASAHVKTPEHCKAISDAKRGKKTGPPSTEHRAAISKAKQGKPRPPHVIDAMKRGKQEAKARRESQQSALLTTESR